uniref:Uncharacterized protein n=1 Tax=Arundo donax TaxID=35708 RepID=A0A0A9D0W3_ARUDO
MPFLVPILLSKWQRKCPAVRNSCLTALCPGLLEFAATRLTHVTCRKLDQVKAHSFANIYLCGVQIHFTVV